jgi:protein-tyrosine-phosphatase
MANPTVTTVLFACVHNAGRSQMAAAFFHALADPHRARAISAGTQPAECVHAEVVEAMREVGIDLAAARGRLLTDTLATTADLLVTMGAASAPSFPACAVSTGRSPTRRVSRQSGCARSARRSASAFER